jgi:hypothetical protein
MAQERDALEGVLCTMGEDVAEYRPPDKDGEDGWSVKEQTVHLAQMDATYRTWCERTLADDNPDLDDRREPVHPVPFTLERAHDHPLADLVKEMDRQRALTVEFIEGLSASDLERTSHNSMFGELTLIQWLRSAYRHDRMHLAQVSGRPSEYQPRFLHGEPDQRRR